MEEKYYKKYLKYKNKYALLKNSFSNQMYAQNGGNPNEYVNTPYMEMNPSSGEYAVMTNVKSPSVNSLSTPAATINKNPLPQQPKPVLRASPK